LDVHKSLGDHFEILNRAFGVEDFKVASGVIVAIFELIKVDLGLLLLCLDEAAICWLDFFEHVEGLLCVTHLHRQVGLGKHDPDLFWSISEFTHCSGKYFLCLIKDLQLTKNLHQIKENTGSLFLSKWQRRFIMFGFLALGDAAWILDDR
jgi:hypothetical protein